MMELKELIAKGEGTEVYKHNNLAVKVFAEDYPKSKVLYEALISARIEDTGLNIPKIVEVSKMNGKWAISMECIEGKTLYEVMKEDPSNIGKYIDQMVDLQLEVHSKRSPLLNKLKDKLIQQINGVACIDSTRRYELLTKLDSMPKHIKLCHGDFNPMNIIIQDKKTFIIDWIDASQGNASADVANTYLFFALNMPEVAELYLDTFCKKSKTEKRYVQQWLPIIAAARLSENVDAEKELLMKWIDVVEYE